MSPKGNEDPIISQVSEVDTAPILTPKPLENEIPHSGLTQSSAQIKSSLVKDFTPPRPRILFIGAGSQGHAYAGPITRNGLGTISAICEPIPFKRQEFGDKYIWRGGQAMPHQQFASWTDFLGYETDRRERVQAGEIRQGDDKFYGVDAVFVCVLDELHVPVVKALAPLGLHVMCEKPLATTLDDCITILGAVKDSWKTLGKQTIFGIGHVLRYSPQNMLLRRIVRDEKVVGDIISVEHTEPVGWWHMAHSFVRGNWRRSDTTAPILLTKCCHDIDFLMWLICSAPSNDRTSSPHLPSFITSSGNLIHYRRARKPPAAGSATNCLSCPIQQDCAYSSKNIYVEKCFNHGDLDWPLKTVVPEIEDIYRKDGKEKAKTRLLEVLSEDYSNITPESEIKRRPWFGRCVWESDNNVCDDQTVTITWEDDPLGGEGGILDGRAAKTAIFHMTAPTEKICERRGRIYGTLGEITYDEDLVSVYSLLTGKTKVYKPESVQGGGHGGGDDSLAEHFCKAVGATISGEMDAEMAQRKWLGCDLEEVVRSHVTVFAAEKARTQRTVVDWREFWDMEVLKKLSK